MFSNKFTLGMHTQHEHVQVSRVMPQRSQARAPQVTPSGVAASSVGSTVTSGRVLRSTPSPVLEGADALGRLYTCRECGRAFGSAQGLAQHTW